MNRCTHIRIRKQQTGAALIVSLMLLLIMTLIGVSSIGTTNLEERMAHNFQNSTVVFQATESAINKIITAGNPGGSGVDDNPFYVEANDPLVAAINTGIGASTTVVTQNMDPNSHLAGGATLTSTSTLVYNGGGLCPGMSTSITCHYFDITAVTAIAATNNRKTHMQGVYRPAPAP